MPIAHLLELWKGIEVEPMETEVSGGGGVRQRRCRRPPFPAGGSASVVPQSSGDGV